MQHVWLIGPWRPKILKALSTQTVFIKAAQSSPLGFFVMYKSLNFPVFLHWVTWTCKHRLMHAMTESSSDYTDLLMGKLQHPQCADSFHGYMRLFPYLHKGGSKAFTKIQGMRKHGRGDTCSPTGRYLQIFISAPQWLSDERQQTSESGKLQEALKICGRNLCKPH